MSSRNLDFTRRSLLKTAALVPLASGAVGQEADASNSLKSKAARRGITFGCGVSAPQIAKDQAFRAAVMADCAEIVPWAEMKWGFLEREEGSLDFSSADALVQFAHANSLKIRGHTLVWYNNLPPWVPQALAGPDGRRFYETHIRTVLSHFGTKVVNWDVVNEAIEPNDKLPGSYRNSPFLKRFGPDYIPHAFEIARSVLPHTPLYYNDYGIEYNFQGSKRDAVLELLSSLSKRGLVDGLGIQSHLKIGLWFDAKAFRSFLADVASLGLSILLTEFDVNDMRAPADIATRDREVADHAFRYLETTLDEKAVKGLVAWGLSDRYTWLDVPPFARRDGLPSRGQPLDAKLQRKPLWDAIARALDGAPVRPS
ncbi:MAG TPA: endo-1,4-beta-xylanase [Methylovirgula sp.]|nr:endo-1,4-beta-xylanase [Methylovirgula sp.]